MTSTLLMLRLEYCRRTGSIPWLLMPWLLVSPGHQQPWHWWCRINESLPSIRKDFSHLHLLSVEKWQKIMTYSDNSWNKIQHDKNEPTVLGMIWDEYINSLWHSDTTWTYRFGSTLVQVMACFLTAPSHYLNRCWLSLLRFCSIHRGRFSQGVPKLLLYKITLLKSLPHLPGVSELMVSVRRYKHISLTYWWQTHALLSLQADGHNTRSICFGRLFIQYSVTFGNVKLKPVRKLFIPQNEN